MTWVYDYMFCPVPEQATIDKLNKESVYPKLNLTEELDKIYGKDKWRTKAQLGDE